MGDIENIEIRFCLIGEHKVGKKSIISRFKILNSTQTVDEAKLHKPGPLQAIDGLKEIPKKLTETFYSKKMAPQAQKRLKNLISFTKILSISSYNISLRFFPISPGVPLPDNLDLKEEDEDYQVEKNYRLRLKNVKEELENVIMKTPKHALSAVEILFVFCFSFTDFSSFEKIRIYYAEMNKYFNISKGYHKVLIGNKVDSKIPLAAEQKALIDSFITENNFNYYEISTKRFFNFEKFFEQLFFDVFGTLRKEFETGYFKERFNNVMMLRPSFPRSIRAPPQPNDNPGPQDYKANVYDIGDDIKSAFTAKRFINKIFVNKQGPLFSGKELKKQEKKSSIKKERTRKGYNTSTDSKRKKSKSQSALRTSMSEKGIGKWMYSDSQKKKELQEALKIMMPGYSLGLKKANLNLKKQRKEEYKRRMQDLENAFEVDNITTNIPRSTGVRDEEYFKRARQQKAEILKNTIEEWKEEYSKYNKLRPKKSLPGNVSESESEDMASAHARNKSASESDGKKKRADNKEIKPKIEKTRLRRPRSHKIFKKERFTVPGPNSYDVRGKFDQTKGFSFAGKHPDNSLKNKVSPPYVLLKSDIDIMLERPRFAFQASVPRKRQYKDFSLNKIIDTWNRWENQKIASERFKLIQEFIDKRKDMGKMNRDKKERDKAQLLEAIEEEERRKKEEYVEQKNNGEINFTNLYKLVEDNSPQFTIKGRYDKGFINAQENYDDPGKLNSLEKSMSQLTKREEINKRDNLPDYNVVKPSLPSFSFPVAERFKKENLHYIPAQMAKTALTEENQAGTNMKHVTSMQYFMGKAPKNNTLKMSEMPGPGQYKIKDFAEIIVQEAERINALKARSKSPQEKKLTPRMLKQNEAVINHEDNNMNSIFQSGDDDNMNSNNNNNKEENADNDALQENEDT